MKTYIKKYAAHIGAAAVVITAVASAAVTPLPGSLPASVANGDIIEASHINDILSSLNILDQRTDGDAPVDNVDIVNKGYLDTAVSAAGDWQKGVICPDGEIFQGYNTDETPKCETPDSLNIASKDDLAGVGAGGYTGSDAAPIITVGQDVNGVTLTEVIQFGFGDAQGLFMKPKTVPCSDLGAGWGGASYRIFTDDLKSVWPTSFQASANQFNADLACRSNEANGASSISLFPRYSDWFINTLECGYASTIWNLCEYGAQ